LPYIPLVPEPAETQDIARATRLRNVQQLLLALFLLQCLVCVGQAAGLLPDRAGRLSDALLVLLATAATLAWLVSQLPLQNVLAACGFLGLLFAAAQSIRGIVFLQPSEFAPASGPQFSGAVPVILLPVWVIALLNARGTATLLLRNRRNCPVYGFLVIGLAALLFTGFELALEGYAAGLKSDWIWEQLPAGHDHRVAAPVSNYAFWFILALAVQVIIAPWLITKKPAPPKPQNSPLIIWLSLVVFLAFAAAVGH
jgi:uncharacterized RDD family membrane protein YckC